MAEDPSTAHALAVDVLALAQYGGMPATFWTTDSRVARACAVLGIAPHEAAVIDWTQQDA